MEVRPGFPPADRPGRPVYGDELGPSAGSERPQAVGRGYISISRSGTGSNPLEWPVYGDELGRPAGLTRQGADVGQLYGT